MRGQVGLERALSRYTWDAKIDEVLTLYRELSRP
jgi:hypothetical protein